VGPPSKWGAVKWGAVKPPSRFCGPLACPLTAHPTRQIRQNSPFAYMLGPAWCKQGASEMVSPVIKLSETAERCNGR